MKVIWAPWRIRYIKSSKDNGCFLCKSFKSKDDKKNLLLYRRKKAFIIMNRYPYNPGHLMIATVEHKSEITELTEEEQSDIFYLLSISKKSLEYSMSPDGFNIGINLGRVAGAGLADHLHIHIVPRWNGDTNFIPVMSDIKIIPSALKDTFFEIKKAIKKIEGGT